MSSGAHPVSHRVHWRRRAVWVLGGLVAAAGIVLGVVVGIDRAFYSGQARQSWPQSWPPRLCVVQGVDARCGTFTIPETARRRTGARSGYAWSSFLRL
jgi:hypothetical protein